MLTTPNIQSDPPFDAQAVPSETDWQILQGGFGGTGVLSGLTVTPQNPPTMTVQVAAGEYLIGGTVYSFGGGSVTVGVPNAWDRVDLITIDTTGTLAVVAGPVSQAQAWTRQNTTALPPIPAPLPAGTCALAAVMVPYDLMAVEAVNLLDKSLDVPANTYAPVASPTFTGTPTAPTAVPGTATTQLATTAFVGAAVGVETSRAEAVESLLAPLANPSFSGVPLAPTAGAGTNTAQVATTAFVTSAVAVETTRAQTAEALLAPVASPALTGVPTAPTAAALTSSTQIATTDYTDLAVGVEKSRAEAAEALLAPLSGAVLVNPGANILSLSSAAGLGGVGRLLGFLSVVGPPTTGTFITNDVVIDSAGSLFMCSAGGTPGTWVSPLTNAAGEQAIRNQRLNQMSVPSADVGMGGFTFLDLGQGALSNQPARMDQLGGWIPDPNVWTYVSGTSFTVPGNLSTLYTVGLHVKWSEAGVPKYGCVASSSYDSTTGLTTVTLIATSAYAMAVTPDALSVYYSFTNPPDYPHAFAWTPVYNGFSTAPTPAQCWWALNNGIMTCAVFTYIAGTSNADTFTINAPVVSNASFGMGMNPAFATDNGTPGLFAMAYILAGDAVISLELAGGPSTWTASGQKGAAFVCAYPV